MDRNNSMPKVSIPTDEDLGRSYKGIGSLETGSEVFEQIGGGYQHKINEYYNAVERYNRDHVNELDGEEVDPLKIILLTNPINASIAKEKKTLNQIIDYTIDNEEENLFAQDILVEILYNEKLRFFTVQKEINEPYRCQESINQLLKDVGNEIDEMKENQHLYSPRIFRAKMKSKLEWQNNLGKKLDPMIDGYNELMEEEISKLRDLARKTLEAPIINIIRELEKYGFIDILKEDGDTYYILNDDWEEGSVFLNRKKLGRDAYLRAKFFEKNEMGLDETKDSNKRALRHIDEEMPVYDIISNDTVDPEGEVIGTDDMLGLLFKEKKT